jgi:ubiquinone/menaquinone biosynthesis C-methylase UbiE
LNNNGKLKFETVTELPGVKVSHGELVQIFTRYKWCSEFVEGKQVLEIACGSGPGVGYMLKKGAQHVLATDISENNLQYARQYYSGRDRVDFDVVDACLIPYESSSFDCVVNFEAIYYVTDLREACLEAFRVLRPGGTFLISSVNREWPGFNPSPFSTFYPNARELDRLLSAVGFSTEIKLGFRDESSDNLAGGIKSFIRWAAVRFKLIPRSMKGKEFLKRVFYGRLREMPHELMDSDVGAAELVDYSNVEDPSEYLFYYAKAVKP